MTDSRPLSPEEEAAVSLMADGLAWRAVDEGHPVRYRMQARIMLDAAREPAGRDAGLRDIAEKLIAAIDANDAANVHGWSRSLKQTLADPAPGGETDATTEAPE